MDAGREALLQDRFAFPLAHGQLYTSYDLTWRAHQQKRLVRSAMNSEMTDPFERIGVDPFWEFKVFTSLEVHIDDRIGLCCRNSYHPWDALFLPEEQAAIPKLSAN